MDFSQYYKNNKKLFGKNLEILDIFIKYISQNEKILDLGCGQGRNLFYLLSKGYNISGVERSFEAVKDLDFEGKIIIGDMEDEKNFGDFFHLIASFSINFSKNQSKFLEKLKQKTLFGGVHLIVDFLERTDKKRGFFTEIEILEMYKNWEILYFEKSTTKTLFGENWPCYTIIARKK